MADLTRRKAIASMLGVASAVVCAPMALARKEHGVKYGYVDPDNCFRVTRIAPADVRVFVDGVDFTRRAVVADDVRGFVEVFDRHDGGGFVVGPDGFLKRRRVYGRVVIRHKDDRTEGDA